MTASYHLCVKYFSQLSFDSKGYTESVILYTLLNQMRVVKNIRRKDDRITSLYQMHESEENVNNIDFGKDLAILCLSKQSIQLIVELYLSLRQKLDT